MTEGQLNSWKEIAGYFGRDVTTVQRWERREGMPVHRHLHDKVGSVYAFRSELDTWAQSRNSRAVQASDTLPPDPAISPEVATLERSPHRSAFFHWPPLITALTGASLVIGTLIGATLLLRRIDYFWRNPIEGARFQTITDFDGVARDAVLSRDGQLLAFLSDHEGQMDVWVTQIGSGEFHNLTQGSQTELVNPSIRTLGFSPDSSLVTFWVRKPGGPSGGGISIWAVPTLGGRPRPYLDGVAELDWSHDGSRLAYHTPGPGDPLYVSPGLKISNSPPLFTAPAGLHSHFPLWSPDMAFLYFVQGELPDKLDVWRMGAGGGAAERITSHFGYMGHPVLLNNDRLIYLARDSDGSGPWLYGMDVARRKPHRLTSGPERYTSLAASADGQRVAATLATPKRTLWKLPVTGAQSNTSAPAPIPLRTTAGFFPRFGPHDLLYVSSAAGSDSLWETANGVETKLWGAPEAQVLAAPAFSADGRFIALSIRQEGGSRLYVMHADGTNAHLLGNSLVIEGAPAWAPDGRSILSAVNIRGVPQLARLPLDGGAAVPLIKEYSVDPVWVPSGGFFLYSGADVGTTFPIKAANPDGTAHQIPAITLTRGARHVVFGRGGGSLFLLRGEIEHKDLWVVDLQTGVERTLTKLPADFNVRDFDLSPDGREVVLERTEERSDIVLLDLARR